MKRFAAAALVLHFSLFALHSPAASPAATQSWVKNYVSTSGTTRAAIDISPVAFSVTGDDGAEETITFSFERADCPAMRVEGSNVPGMANGTLFAENGAHSYANTANLACTGFAGAEERIGWVMLGGHYEYATNGTDVASNLVYVASNAVNELRFVLEVNGGIFTSAKMKDGRHKCASTADPSSVFYLRRCTVTSRERAELLAPPVSLWGLLFPSAYAWTQGDKMVYASERVGDYIYDYWTRHYYTDGTEAALSVKCGTVTITSGGQSRTFDLGDVWLLRIDAEVDFCNLASSAESGAVLTEEELFDVLKERLGPGRAVQMKASSAWTDLLSKLVEAAKLMKDIYASVSECPEEGRDEHFEPIIVPHVCGDWTGECGAWRCGRAACTNVVESVEGDPDHPAEHEWGQTEKSGECQWCIHCGKVPDDESLHAAWHDAVAVDGSGRVVVEAHRCVCSCGKKVLLHRSKAETMRFVCDPVNPYVCWEVWRCNRCREVVEPEDWLWTAVDELHDGGFTISAGAHNELRDGKFTAVTVENPHTGDSEDVCQCSYTCHHFLGGLVDLGCGALRTENFEHIFAGPPSVVAQIDDEFHAVKIPCVNGFVSWDHANSNWCGQVETTNEHHRIGFETTAPWDDPEWPATRTHHTLVKCCGHRDALGGFRADPLDHECGAFIVTNAPHSTGRLQYAYLDNSAHAISNYCFDCNGTFLYSGEDCPTGIESHGPSGEKSYTYHDLDYHVTSNRCEECRAWYTDGTGMERHDPLPGVFAYAYTDARTHTVSNLCNLCVAWYYFGEEGHVARYEEPVRAVARGAFTHDEYNVCDRCARDVEGIREPAEFLWRTNMACTSSLDSWLLVDSADSNDVERCQYCTNATNRPHAWTYTDDVHWCANGRGHLRGAHVWPELVAGTPCAVCGFPYTPPPPQCPHCACREVRCSYWSGYFERCTCPYCNNREYGGYDDCGNECWCEKSEPFSTNLVYVVTNGATRAANGSASVANFNAENSDVTGDVNIPPYVNVGGTWYPVTQIGSDQHYNWVSGDLTVKDSGTITNIKTTGLAYRNGLSSISLPGVKTVDLMGIYGNLALTNVDLPSAETFGDYAISDCKWLTTVELPNATTFGNYAFSSDNRLTTVKVPKATYFKHSAFNYSHHVHLYLEQPTVVIESFGANFDYSSTCPVVAVHIPKGKTVNGVSYPAETITLGGQSIPIVWEE